MASGIPYKQAKLAETWDAIVIGSGIGGLTAAVLLGAHAGKRVLVLERHYEAGGFTHTFHRPGYEWDVGLHYIGQMQDERSTVRRAFDHVTAGGVQWQPMPEIYDRFIIEGRTFDYAAGLERFREGLRQSFPAEIRAIDRYIAAVQACNRASGLYYAEKAVPAPVAALAGSLMRMPYMRWARHTTREVLESFTGNRELIGVLTGQWGDYGLPPGKSSFAVHATIAEHYFGGASYPVGGAGVIAAAIVPQIEDAGGTVVTSAEVSAILVDGARAAGVRMSDGREFRSGVVLSDAGAANTFERLLPPNLPALDSLRRQLRQSSAFHRACQPLCWTVAERCRAWATRHEPLGVSVLRSRCECRAVRAGHRCAVAGCSISPSLPPRTRIFNDVIRERARSRPSRCFRMRRLTAGETRAGSGAETSTMR